MRSSLLLLFVALAAAGGDSRGTEPLPLDPDVGKGMELVAERGFQLEDHFVTTEDGYILHMFRIPQPGAAPVLLQHGLLDSSFTWVNNFRNESLAYILSDAGYDVWLGNNRGNFYSANHTTLAVEDNQFWAFTYDEMAKYDLPGMVRYIQRTTGQSNLGYVGHSEGTIQAFAGLTFPENADVAASVSFFGALAPVAYVSNMKSKLARAFADARVCEILALLGDRNLLDGDVLNVVAPELCRHGPHLCSAALVPIVGPSLHYNTSRLQVYVSKTPAGTSMRNMMHWGQVRRARESERGLVHLVENDCVSPRTP
uniref:Partial AB-hydrolase lipase domain-containing protein n=1 Tax=Rhizochromulina marina TaxID=1034831 RepID=A0A7S2WV56_9STRA|mmetsp:Transcript_7894/g.22447  ORF Transcript_7894/g.22447 Transcript_7894/m.22447 type:complete len:312 (+) Transcript_7894:1-936(+)